MSTRQRTGTAPGAGAPAFHRTGQGTCPSPPANPVVSPPASPSQSLPIFLPVPAPEQVHAARAHLTSLHADGVDAVMWEARRHPMPDDAAIGAVIAASQAAQAGAGVQPGPLEVAAALVLLEAVRLETDQTEARLLNTAQAAAMGWEQIAAILGVDVQEAEERHRQLKPRLDEPVAHVAAPLPARATGRSGSPAPRRALNWDASTRAHVWDETDEPTGDGRPAPGPPQHPR